jgi:geranylgeranyl pyrophosphate synthase
LIVLTDGQIGWHEAKNDFDWANTTALPPQLAKAFAEEPLYTDLRWARTIDQLSLRHSQFRAAILEMAATLLDRSKDELDGDDVRQHRRTRRLAWSGVAILAVLFFVAASAGYIALQQRNVAMQRFADLCKALSESQVLSDASNHGSVYHFQSEYAAIKDQCTELGYQPW